MNGTPHADATAIRKPTVLMLTADRRIDRRILLEADALESDGWSVTILGMALDDGEKDNDPRVVRIGSSRSINSREYLLISAYRRIRRVVSMNSLLMRRMKMFAWKYLTDQEQFFKTAFLQDALNYPSDVVYAHDLPMLPVARAVAETFNAKLVYDNHELYAEQEFSDFERRKWIEIEKRHIGAADLVIAVNQSIATELERRYDLAKVHVILNAEHPMPVAGKPDTLRKKLNLPENAIVGLFQGGLSEGRNLKTLVQAMQYVDVPEFHLVFLGDGALFRQLRREAARIGMADRVHFLAAVPQAELLDHSASADFGIIPYQPVCLNTRYCTPNKMFEFIAAGLPIISSDLPELRRFVVGFGLGLVADLSSPRDAAQAISRIAGDPSMRRDLAVQVVAAQSQISWSIEGAQLSSIIAPLKPVTRI